MARMQIKGVEEYALKLSRLGDNVQSIGGEAIYSAADIVANQIRSNLKGIKTVSEIENIQAYKSGKKSQLSGKQKQGLLDSLGITKLRNDEGFMNVKIGFDGYNAIKTKKYPKGQPNQLIARVTENGSSYMDKTPFIRPAVTKTRKPAQEAMQQVIDKRAAEIIG